MEISRFTIPIHAFNYNVNHSGDLFKKYNDWVYHREKIMRLIDQAQRGDCDKKSVIVLGAGGCNDLDLSFLAKHFDEIVLTDVDVESIYEGIRRQELAQDFLSKIIIERVEYTGFETIKFFEDLQRLIETQSPTSKIKTFIENRMASASKIEILEKYKGTFQMVLSAPIYTQLILTQLNVILGSLMGEDYYQSEEIEHIRHTFLNHMPKIIRGYNNLLLSLSAPNAAIAVWSDIIQLDPNHETMNVIKNMLSDTDGYKAIEQYVEKDGMGIGTYGCKDLLGKIEQKGSMWWIWPFDDNRHFLVNGIWGHIRYEK